MHVQCISFGPNLFAFSQLYSLVYSIAIVACLHQWVAGESEGRSRKRATCVPQPIGGPVQGSLHYWFLLFLRRQVKPFLVSLLLFVCQISSAPFRGAGGGGIYRRRKKFEQEKLFAKIFWKNVYPGFFIPQKGRFSLSGTLLQGFLNTFSQKVRKFQSSQSSQNAILADSQGREN